MVGTIEPRVIAPNSSFNELSWESFSYPRLDLPPLPSIQHSDGFQSPNRPVVLAPLAQQQGLAGLQPHEHYDADPAVGQYGFSQIVTNGLKSLPRLARATTSQSLSRILADEAEPTPTPPRKRQRKDEFVKLPQPEKKQKSALQVPQPLVPPIIVGIVPPANQHSKFRPIVDGGPFRDVHGRSSLNSAADEARGAQKEHIRTRTPPKEVQPVVDPASSQEPLQDEPPVESTPRVVQPRNKWTDEETKHLLLGVKKHGIGNWKKILEDTEFTFNNRKAVHIKDRFRTCFPDGCDGSVTGAGVSGGKKPLKEMKSIPNQDGTVAYGPVSVDTRPGSLPASKPPNGNHKKSKSHRKDLSDLQEIGILQPFRKSERRARRAFTAEEDKNILLGFQKHGRSNWSAIKKDPELGLESRKPTDIRDRFRTRYPDKHREVGEEKDGKEERQDLLRASGGLRTVVSIEELLDHDVSASSQSQISSQPQNQVQAHQQDTMQFLPSTSSPSYPDILSTSNRLPKMLSFTELLSDSAPLPAMDVPGDPFSFTYWNDPTSFGGEEFWLPEIQTLLQPPAAVGSGAGRENTGRSAYDLSNICEAVDHPYGGQGMLGDLR